MKCNRCGMPLEDGEYPFHHTNCDEEFETWLTDEERKEKAKRIEAYWRKKTVNTPAQRAAYLAVVRARHEALMKFFEG